LIFFEKRERIKVKWKSLLPASCLEEIWLIQKEENITNTSLSINNFVESEVVIQNQEILGFSKNRIPLALLIDKLNFSYFFWGLEKDDEELFLKFFLKVENERKIVFAQSKNPS